MKIAMKRPRKARISYQGRWDWLTSLMAVSVRTQRVKPVMARVMAWRWERRGFMGRTVQRGP